jgi:hypothetical protein
MPFPTQRPSCGVALSVGCVERGQGWNELRWCVQGWLGHERRKGSIMTGDEIMMGGNVKRASPLASRHENQLDCYQTQPLVVRSPSVRRRRIINLTAMAYCVFLVEPLRAAICLLLASRSIPPQLSLPLARMIDVHKLIVQKTERRDLEEAHQFPSCHYVSTHTFFSFPSTTLHPRQPVLHESTQ